MAKTLLIVESPAKAKTIGKYLGPGYVVRASMGHVRDLPALGDFIPSVDSMVVMIVFTMMAVGLNIVVGYAGLLDLGYVAFYAVGAYTAAWFASQQFDQWSFHFGSVGISKDAPGIHLSIWLVLVMAGALAAVLGYPPVEQVAGAAAEALGAKADGDAVRKAVEEGFRWAS